MYLTVQRIRSPRHNCGINGALYLHNSERRDLRWSPPDLHAIIESGVGRQVAARVDVAPGGNDIESFLDIVCPDDVSAAELRDALNDFQRKLTTSHQLEICGFFAIKFSVNVEGEGNAPSSFSELRDAALELFSQPRDRPWLRQEPLTIQAEANDAGWRFTIEDASRQRLTSHFGTDLQLARISIPFDAADNFRAMYGEIYPFVVEAVVSKPRNELLSLGGVRLVHKGKTIWEWPRRT